MNRVALVTAAGSGMGAACARELAAHGYRVGVFSSTDKSLALAREIDGWGYVGSVDDAPALEQFVQGAIERWGRIDALVNSAPHPPKGELLALTDDDWRRGMDLVLLPVIRLARMITPIFEQQGGGAVVNISTFAAFEPDLNFPISASLRAALASFAKLYADRYAKANIRMNNVLPGYIDSLAEKPERVVAIPMRRYGRVSEIAKTVAFLLSDDAAYITGQNVRVDGGLTRSV